MQEETIPITLWVSGRDYRIRIKPEDEEAIRAAVDRMNDRLQDLKRNFHGKDEQDFIAMCLLMYATEEAVSPKKLNSTQSEMLKHMIEKVQGALGEQE